VLLLLLTLCLSFHIIVLALKMPILDPKYFGGGGDLPPDLAARLLATGVNDELATPLTTHGWQGQGELVAGVCLSVSPDGEDVQAARFFIRGDLCPEPVAIKANLLWRAAADINLSITLPPAQAFDFSGGSLCSEYLEQERVTAFNYAKSGQPIMPGDWRTHKLGNFCLRLVAHLDKSANTRAGPSVKFTVLIFPDSGAATLGSDEGAQSVSWPGFRLLEGRAELYPRPPRNLWGAPLLPLIATHLRAADCNTLPSGDKMRFAVAELMRTAALPTVCVTKAARAKTVRTMQRAPENLDPRAPTIIWPAAPRPPADEGMFLTANTTVAKPNH